MAQLLPQPPWPPSAEGGDPGASGPPAEWQSQPPQGRRADGLAPEPWRLLEVPSIHITPCSDGESPPGTPTPQRLQLPRTPDPESRPRDSTTPHSGRSTPSSSPSLRKRLQLLPSSRPPPEPEPGTMVEKGSDSSSEKGGGPGTPSTQSLGSRNFIRNSKKMQSWYSMLSPTYKQRNEDFRKLFSKLPEAERLIVDYSCALQREILLQGRLYLSENWICFYSNIFRWETTISIQLKEVTCLKKEKTAKLIPNAIQICTESEKHFFTSFGARDRCFLLIFRLWQNALLEKTLSPRELWHLVHQCYGSELGLTSEDEDYVCPLQLNGLGSPKEVGDVIALSDITPSGAADNSQEPSPVGSRRGRLTPNLSRASSDADHVAEEDKEEQTDSQPDASSSQTVTPVAEPPSTEPAPPNGPASLGPLDLLPSEEVLTDTSNSSSSTGEEADLAALLPDLSGRLLINSVFHVGAERLQQMLFSDSPFLQGFLQQCKFTDVTLSPWSGDNKCHQRRVLTYTIPISNPLGPKSASVVETQTLFRRGPQAGGCVVDSEVLTQGIPYQDYFYTAHRYCILGLARNKARLRVSSEIRYRKQPWSLVKSLIEKNSWSGIEDYFHHLERELAKAEKLSLEEGGKDARGLLSGLRRRKRPLSWRGHGDGPQHPDPDPCARAGMHTSGSLSSRFSEPSVDQGPGAGIPSALVLISIVICVSLIVLIALNVLLFYRLWSLERTAHTFESWHSLALAKGKFPQTATEWAEILALQKQFHSVEVHKWRQILRASVELLDEMKFSLEKLHQGITVSDPPFDSQPRPDDSFS
ncbi:protein Aster-A isoform X3 [Canis lupus familiaris]|uniref:protein Aster-A isoform X3 n=1 Tax=Canis lupus familiaris TaxID=9615 RepID=UPI0003AE27B9|nr:protein Aster-A isoform X3 [Canis lupus familiaris]XP_038513414.1 protein Aster-A isoform X3 [Canis lupus familiaris]|eukprot:XP_005616784.1 GRAM domain-containing protein 1A isoform X1 [Canis lupus familiaris]